MTIIKNCKICTTEFKVCPARDKTAKYCSVKCVNKSMKGSKRHLIHGLSKTQFWNKWISMIRRCKDASSQNYKNYGGRGIKVCNRWLKFKNFKDDIYLNYLNHSKKYGQNDTQLDRINNSKNYSKNNCKWSTDSEQRLNKRTNRFVTYKSKTQTLKEWAMELNIKYGTLQNRINRDKWSIEEAFTYVR